MSVNAQQGWVRIYCGTTYDLNSVYFTNDSTGWIVGGKLEFEQFGAREYQTIRKTTNGGDRWMSQITKQGFIIESVFFANDSTGWADGGVSKLLKTTNGGTEWIYHLAAAGSWTSRINSIYFTNDTTGWIVGWGGRILKTINGGTKWFDQTSGTSNELESIYFNNDSTGWVVGELGTILKTTNGGTSWISQKIRTSRYLCSVCFTNDSTGWVVGSEGTILKTKNGGATWILQYNRTKTRLNSVFFTNDTTGWVVGDKGIMLRTTTGGETYVEETHDSNSIIPNQIVLFQNYPNPFNSTTTICFNLPKSSFVTLKVYNLLGENIETLISCQRSAGEYEVRWNAKGLSSGIYFYRLESGEFIETKKFILQK